MTSFENYRQELHSDALTIEGILRGVETLQNEVSHSLANDETMMVLTKDARRKAARLVEALDSANAPRAATAPSRRAAEPQSDLTGDNAADLFDRWKIVRVAKRAATDVDPTGNWETPELKTLEDQAEVLCKLIAASKPETGKDAVAMLEWAELDGNGEIFDPMYGQARQAALAYLIAANR